MTPNDLPAPTLEQHRPYLACLIDTTARLDAVNLNFCRLIYELRVAREPMGRPILDNVRDIYETLEAIGAKGKETFDK